MNDTTNAQEQFFSSEDIEKNKVVSLLAYILFFIPLFAAPDSKFARYHANQGLILFIFSIALNIVGSITTFIFIGLIILAFGWIFILVLVIMGIINALNGQAKPLPLIGNFTILK